MSPTVVLISGAKSGVGKGLLERYIARPQHIVIAAIRDPDDAAAKELIDLPEGSGSSLVIVKVDATSDKDASAAAKELERQGIDHLDIVIANAGVMFAACKVSEIKISDIEGHMATNFYGVVRRFQAMLPLLLRSKNPKWITIGSDAGSIGLTKKIDAEEEKLAAFVVHPGWVHTKMGVNGASLYGFGGMTPPVAVADSVNGIVQMIDNASKESHGGRFRIYDGTEKAW